MWVISQAAQHSISIIEIRAMITAIVLAKVEKGTVAETAQELAAFPSISEVYSVSGPYDLILMVRTKTNDELADIVTNQIQKQRGVAETTTQIAFRAYSRYDLEHIFSID